MFPRVALQVMGFVYAAPTERENECVIFYKVLFVK